MNCETAQDILNAYADGELDAMHEREVETHISACTSCSAELGRTNNLREAFRDGSLYFKAPDPLRIKIESSLPEKRAAWLPRPVWIASLAAAAAVLLLVMGIFYFRDARSNDDMLAAEIVSSHVRSMMVDHVTDVASTDQHTVKPWFEGKLDYSPPVTDLASEGFPLIGGRLDYIGGRSVAALVYQRRQHVINLFVFPASGNADPAQHLSERQGFNLVRWTHDGMSFCAVSDLNLPEMQEFAQKLQS